MFMNKISMTQTCLYNISYKKIYKIQLLQRHSAVVQHYTDFSTVQSRVTVGSCLVEYEYKLLCQTASIVAHKIYLYDIAAGPRKDV